MSQHIFTNSHIITLREHETVLEALERSGYRPNYQCRSGYCGQCRLKTSAGEVDYLREPLAPLGDHEILACCARPKNQLHLNLTATSITPTRVASNTISVSASVAVVQQNNGLAQGAPLLAPAPLTRLNNRH